MKILSIVPARAGSKGIPGKNIKPLAGIPLLGYSIAAGLQAKSPMRVIVSTDEARIGRCAKNYGAEFLFLRPQSLAEDYVQDLPVISHALLWLNKNEGYKPDIIVLLRPTSPFRPIGCIDEAIKIMKKNNNVDCVRAVIPSGEEPYKMWKLSAAGMRPLLKSRFREPYNMPRQKLPKTYWQTGQIEVIRYSTIIEKKSMTGSRIYPIIMNPRFSIDIDNPEQWEVAEVMMKKFRKENVVYVPKIKKGK